MSLIFSEGLSIFMKNTVFCSFLLVSLLGDDHLKIIYHLRWIELFIEYLLVPNIELGSEIKRYAVYTIMEVMLLLGAGWGRGRKEGILNSR